MHTVTHSDENKLLTQIRLLQPNEVNSFSRCPFHNETKPYIEFRIQRDDSHHNSIIKYKRLDTNQIERFTFNTGGSSDNTYVAYDGSSLTCNHSYGSTPQCNRLPVGKAIPAEIYEIHFDPRNGKAHQNQWSRNKYTLLANYYVIAAKCTGKM